MPIVSSTHVVGHAQEDGRSYVTETHTDDAGAVLNVVYLAAVGTDYVAVRDARALTLSEQLAEQEASDLLG
jgi:hypothetical protein